LAHDERQPRQAQTHLQQAIQLDAGLPDAPEWLVLQADVALQLGDTKAAQQCYEKLAVRDPQNIDALDGLIRIAWLGNDGKTALARLHQLADRATDAATMARVAVWHQRMNQPDEAFRWAQRIASAEMTPAVHAVLGFGQMGRRDYSQACVHFARADLDAPVLVAWIEALLRLGKLQDAIDRIAVAGPLEQPPADLARRLELVKQLTQRRNSITIADALMRDRVICLEYWADQDEPIDTLLMSIPDNVATGIVTALRAEQLVHRGRLRQARPLAEAAVTRSPTEWRGYAVRGRIRLESGDATAAILDLRQAVKFRAVPDGRLLHDLATALMEAGAPDEALDIQRQAVKLRPRDEEIREQLTRWEKATK